MELIPIRLSIGFRDGAKDAFWDAVWVAFWVAGPDLALVGLFPDIAT